MQLQELLYKIKSLQIQGAQEIALEALKFLRAYGRRHGYRARFFKAAAQIERARPTAVVLHNCLKELRADPAERTIARLLARIRRAKQQVARHATFIKSGHTILTHCHSGVAMAVLKHAHARGKKIKVIATETEPKEQGIRTARELARARIPVSLITDSAVAYYMPKVDYVLVGSDALRAEGNVNKIGSLNIAIAAHYFKKPYYVAASTLKFDRRPKIKIEMRPPSEVYKPLKGVKILNPAFDITPWKLITRIITEKGIMTPGNLIKLLR